ncbi:FtsX-like permease family protein [Anaerocolumna xylanovorans]|uniref:Putative ABC transport system permease protein n=1 Tax=Anaerocolumna xylanovorans DSM 12503 TaxID=1121345 RepID=A0A1M7YJP0_9FIRM|nr:FtsX-like permease family protein [Anaerocolumna xylanovorans]SHO52844.1 putative ABC transport system permease protein [Anaerocolumna xylanovorans DSM 12503]
MVMMNSAWNKNNRREVSHTLGRYIAILVIIALGVGFFSGLKITKEAMIQMGDTYIKKSNMYDYRLLSTLGFTDEDIRYMNELDGIKAAEGAVSADFMADFNGQDDVILKAHSITGKLNQVNLTAGRLPKADNECVADALNFTKDDIGKTISLSGKNDKDIINSFAYEKYTIVGLCNSVNYMYRSDRGTTKLAGGFVNAFLYIPKGGFSFDYYSEIYVTMNNDNGQIFSKDYEDAVFAMKQPLTDAVNYRAELRYQDILKDANEKIADSQSEYDASQAKYVTQKTGADNKLNASLKKLEDGKAEITKKEKLLTDSTGQLEEKEEKYNTSLADYTNSKAEYEKKKKDTQDTLAAKQKEIKTNRSKVAAAMKQIEQSGVLDQHSKLEQSKTSLEGALVRLTDKTSTEYKTYAAQLEQVKQALAQMDDSDVIKQYQALTVSLAQINAAQAQLDISKETANAKFASTKKQLVLAESQLTEAKQTLENYKKQIADGKTALADAKKQYDDGLKNYNKAKKETEDSLSDAKYKLADALGKINDAKAKVQDIAKPTCYVLDRSKNVGYAGFENDSSVVEGIAKIFPIFFFLVAALVCSTTMTRMVDEQRTQIGTLKALGYSNKSIALKYVSYSGSAAILGCILGYFTGTKLFPFAIWQAYKMIYNFAEIKYVFSGYLALLTLAVSLLCSVGATYVACRTELSQMPAELMRPKAPKSGKRIFLERIPFLWSKITFLRKVSVRNILRYKKRLVMMILGTGGCTALLLAGLGLNDSISNIADDQFDTIMLYDYTISFPQVQTDEETSRFKRDTANLLSECVFICTDTYEVTNKKGSQKVNVIASDDPAITKVIDLHFNGKPFSFPSYGYVAINDRLAETEGLETGDTMAITLNNTENYTVTIGGIFKNYAYNYMYMSGATYQKVFGQKCSYKTAYARTDSSQIYDISAKLMKDYGASNVIVTADTRKRVTNMMNSLNYIVWLVIACACALSFVVMYNLSNINITERNREIATIKVLGFYPSETYSYVFRENIVITIISMIFGLPAGILLHRFVMEQIKIEAVSFNIRILPASYLYALAVTIGLTIFVNAVLIRKIDRINMAESLKSVE